MIPPIKSPKSEVEKSVPAPWGLPLVEARRLWLFAVFTCAVAVTSCLVWVARNARAPHPAARIAPLSGSLAARRASYGKLARAKALMDDGNVAEALRLFEEVASSEGDSGFGWDARIQAAWATAVVGEHEAALSRIERCIGECPFVDQLPLARTLRADVLDMMGRHQAAIVALDDIVSEHAGGSQRICSEAMFMLCRVHARSGHYGLQRAALDRIMADFPGAEQGAAKNAGRIVRALEDMVKDVQEPVAQRLLEQDSAIAVEQILEGITTWTPAEGPYLLRGRVVIGPQATLVIEAGTTVLCGWDAELCVQGAIEVRGTRGRPVRLTVLADDPDWGWWRGITALADAADARIDLTGCVIAGALVGLRVEAGSAAVDDCEFDRCIRAGIHTSARALLRLRGSLISESRRVGIECAAGTGLAIHDCVVDGAALHGLVLDDVRAQTSIQGLNVQKSGGHGALVRGGGAVRMQGCRFSTNGGAGVHAIDGAPVSILESELDANGGAGIGVEQEWDGVIARCRIERNRGGGIRADARCMGRIEQNLIEGNALFGLRLRLASSPQVLSNRIQANGGPGIWLIAGSQPVLRDNAIVENSEAALQHDGNEPIDAAQNWWGSQVEQHVAGAIRGLHLDERFGPVSFEPWLTEVPESGFIHRPSR
jgi:parallel beta-helix repeat protein